MTHSVSIGRRAESSGRSAYAFFASLIIANVTVEDGAWCHRQTLGGRLFAAS